MDTLSLWRVITVPIGIPNRQVNLRVRVTPKLVSLTHKDIFAKKNSTRDDTQIHYSIVYCIAVTNPTKPGMGLVKKPSHRWNASVSRTKPWCSQPI